MGESKRILRDDMFGEIIAALNDEEGRFQSGRGGLFDCGILGCCLVYQSRAGWECTWHELEKLPWEVRRDE